MSAEMHARARLDLDDLLQRFVGVGFAVLIIWVTATAIGAISGFSHPAPQPTLRFLLAILIVTFARRTYWEVREWRWRHIPVDERYGFANPLFEHPRSWEGRDTISASPQHPAG